MEHRNAWLSYSAADEEAVESFARDYKEFISTCKTERECAAWAIEAARAAGYVSIDEARAAGRTLAAGDKVYADCYGKSVIFAHIGSRPLEQGMNILGAHIDSPRLDIKQNPAYEAGGLAFLDTHYYGGIKKYQWVTLPLAIHGVVAKKDGSIVQVNVGEDAGDPVFCVTDLLIHLAQEQMQNKAAEVVEGEALDVLVGGRPAVKADAASADAAPGAAEADASFAIDDADDLAKLIEKEPVKARLLSILAEKYGMEEADFLSSELEVVPAGPARDCGFDSSMILGYGHDDRVCAYPSLIAQLEATDLDKTGLCVVSAGFDPGYASAFETKNAAYLGRGIVFNKFTGSRGKSGSNDANAEFMATVRRVMEQGDAAFQTAELGRVDLGGGGTIAYILAKYGMNVIDAGVSVLNMHAPWEVIDKADLYEALKAYRAFLKYA